MVETVKDLGGIMGGWESTPSPIETARRARESAVRGFSRGSKDAAMTTRKQPLSQTKKGVIINV